MTSEALEEPLVARKIIPLDGITSDVETDDASSRRIRPVVTYETQRARFLMAGISCLLLFLNANMWISFAPVKSLVKILYGVSDLDVCELSLVYMVCFLPGAILSVWINDKFGLRANVVFGSLLLMVGGWIRFISISHYHDEIALTFSRSYPLLLTGQILLALAGPICLNSPAHVSVNWFPRSERHIATVTGIIFFALGVATSQSISSSVVKCVPPESTNPSDIDLEMNDIVEFTECDSYESIEGMETLLFVHALAAAFMCLVSVTMFREKPESPPSRTSELQWKERKRVDRDSDLRKRMSETHMLFRNKEFLKLLFGFTIVLALVITITTMISEIIQPLYYDSGGTLDIQTQSEDAGLFGTLMATSGIIFTAIICTVLHINQTYREFLKGLSIITGISFVFWSTQLRSNDTDWMRASFILLGGTLIPLLAVSFESALECTYPIPAQSTAMVMIFCGKSLAFAIVYSLHVMLENTSLSDEELEDKVFTNSEIFFLAIFGISIIPTLLFEGEYFRLAAINRGKIVTPSFQDDPNSLYDGDDELSKGGIDNEGEDDKDDDKESENINYINRQSSTKSPSADNLYFGFQPLQDIPVVI